MKIATLMTTTAALAASMLFNVSNASAQDNAGPPPPEVDNAAPAPAPAPAVTATTGSATNAAPPRDAGRGQRPSPEEFRKRMNERIKTALKATDDEWTVIQPLLEKVQEKQRETMMGRFGGFGGGRRGGNPGGDPAAGGNRPDRAGTPEVQALRTALETDNTPVSDIKAKLQAVRDARKKAATELDQARDDLKKVLSLRQEATLVMMGMLE